MKKLLILMLSFVLATALLAGCSSSTGTEANEDDTAEFTTQIEVAGASDTASDSTSTEDTLDADALSDENGADSADNGEVLQSEISSSTSSRAGSGSVKASVSSPSSAVSSTQSSGSKASSAASSSTAGSSASSSKASSSAASSKPSSSSSKASSVASSSKAASSKSSVGSIGSFSMTDLNGSSANQSLLNNYKLTMINVWATYCNPCITEIPEISSVYSQVKSKGVNIIGVAKDGPGNTAAIQKIVDDTGASYKMYIPSASMLNSSFMSKVTFVPTTFFADGDGNLVGEPVSGTRTASAWQKIINERLAMVE